MSFIELSAFDSDLVNCEIVRSAKPNDKAKVKLSYGPAKRAIAFITPPFVCDWPQLSGYGNYGSKFGPTELDKAQYTVGVTNRPLDPETNKQLDMYFNALRSIDAALTDFVHANQKELLHTRDLSRDEVKGKLSATVKPKYEEDLLVYHRQQLSARKFDFHGQERHLKIVDAQRREYVGEVHHEDVLMAAVQLDCVYTGLAGGLYGCKWTLLEVMHVNRAGKSVAAPGQGIWAAVSVPSWADEPEAKKQKTEPEDWGSAFGQPGL